MRLCTLGAAALEGVEPYGCPGMDEAAVVNALKAWGRSLDHRLAERLCLRAEAEDKEEAGEVESVTPGNASGEDHDADVFSITARVGQELEQLGRAIEMSTEGRPNVSLLELLSERLRDAALFLWHQEGKQGGDNPPPEGWDELRDELWAVPVLFFATKTATADPAYSPLPGHSEQWYWCVSYAQTLGRRLVEWTEAQGAVKEAAHV